ncbi:MAG: hypothetical protein EOP53_03950, partial [Sphingobacteriales bacterium]
METHYISSDHLSLEEISRIISSKKILALSDSAKAKILKCRKYLDDKLNNTDALMYGINTGFGSLCDIKIDPGSLRQLQDNLVRSHACGVGEKVPQPIVKLMLLLKIQSLSYGYSGVQLQTVDRLIFFYNNDLLPVVFEKGCEVTNPGWPETEIIPSLLGNGERDSINRAVDAAKNADVIIAVLGEDEKTVGESLSRTSLDLPGRQQQFLEALYATGKPVVLVLINGQPLTINWANRFVPAILGAGFHGPSGGKAVAEALFGEYNPGGKLSMTWPKTVGQIELNFPYKPGSQAGQSASDDPNGFGRTRVNGPLYPFGYGLSYTSF